MYQKSPSGLIKHIDFMILDLISFLSALCISYFIYFHSWKIWETQTYKSLLILLPLVHICVSAFDSNYKDILRRGYLKELIATFRHIAIVITITLLLAFFIKTSGILSRGVMLYTTILSLLVIYAVRSLWKKYIHFRLAQDPRLLLLVTDEAGATRILRQFHDQMLDFKVTGIALIKDENAAACSEKENVAINEAAVSSDSVTGAEVTAGRDSVTGAKSATSGDSVISMKDMADSDSVTGTKVTANRDNGITIEGVPVVADTDSLVDYLLKNAIDEILFSIPQGTRLPADLIRQCSLMGVTIHLEMMSTDELAGARYQEDIAGLTVMTSYLKLITAGQALLKRLLDIVGGLVGLFFAAIVFIFVAPAIYIADPGPIFFVQKRVGKNGRIFNFYKFRSMYQDAEARKADLMAQNEIKGQMFKMENDPRIIGSGPDGTRHGIGHFIRSTSLDEFPQFWNVLKGDMSLVGTRPPTVDEWAKYDIHHRARLAVKPGITGLWQISGRSDIDDFEEVVRLDTTYIQKWTFSLDIKILVKTVFVILSRKGSK